MALVPRIRVGNYGNGVFGVKTSLPGFDVTVLADDNDVTKRSFNSEWASICNIKIIGAASSEWTQSSTQGSEFIAGTGFKDYSRSSWVNNTPVNVATGLAYISVWEERILQTVNDEFYDDYLVPGPGNVSSGSGGRSCHAGPGISPANTIFFRPFDNNPDSAGVTTENATFRGGSAPFTGYPAYPAYPPKPSYRPTCVYVIYSNKLGDVS